MSIIVGSVQVRKLLVTCLLYFIPILIMLHHPPPYINILRTISLEILRKSMKFVTEMGFTFTGGLVKSSVFSKNSKSPRRWGSVKSYLCGNELNSVLGEQDSASFKSSEVTVSETIQQNLNDEGDTKSEETVENVTYHERKNSISKSLNEDEAAVIIQLAYRSFKMRHKNEDNIKSKTGKEELNLVTESPDRKSMATSIEAQTGNSTEVFSLDGEKMSIYHKNRTRGVKQKEEWDDSTVSSYVSKMRMQNRMEATTRRERALAYAFSQQLRICSKRKSTKHNIMEPNMSWSWLERWMATRLPETSSVESHAMSMKQYDPFSSDDKITIRTRFLDAAAGEEKESCGSNELPLHFDNYSMNSQEEKVSFKPQTPKRNFKARRTVSRRKTVPSYQFHEENTKECKRDGSSNASKEIKQKQKQVGSKTEMTIISTPKTSNE